MAKKRVSVKEDNLWANFVKRFEVNPLTLLDKNEPRVSPEVAEERLGICEQCKHYIKITHQCRKCFCYMPAKVTLSKASCPVSKWEGSL